MSKTTTQLPIGFNVNIRHGLVTSARHAHDRTATAFQIFLRAPHSFKGKRQNHQDLVDLREEIQKYQQRVVVHGSYIMNFCRPRNNYIHFGGIKLLTEDLQDAHTLGAVGVIAHMGKAKDLDRETAINNYVQGITTCLKKVPVGRVILETGAGVGTEVGTMLPSLGDLRRRVPSAFRDRVGFCLDTCHMFSAGYHLGDPDYVEIVLREIEIHLGWENVWCIHLNDSYGDLNCHSDNHADLGKGYINLEGLSRFVVACLERDIMIVLETPTDWLDAQGKKVSMKKDKKAKYQPQKGETRLTFPDQVEMVRNWYREAQINKKLAQVREG